MDLNLTLLTSKQKDLAKHKVLLIGVALAVVCAWYGYIKIYKSGVAAIGNIKAQAHGEKLRYESMKKLEMLQKEFYHRCKDYFAKETDILWLINKISQTAKATGLEIISLSPKPLVSLNYFLYGNVTVSIRGTFHQLGDFISDLEKSPQCLRIEKLSFRKDREFLNAEVVIGTYFWKD